MEERDICGRVGLEWIEEFSVAVLAPIQPFVEVERGMCW